MNTTELIAAIIGVIGSIGGIGTIIFGDCTAEKQWSSFGWVKYLFKK